MITFFKLSRFKNTIASRIFTLFRASLDWKRALPPRPRFLPFHKTKSKESNREYHNNGGRRTTASKKREKAKRLSAGCGRNACAVAPLHFPGTIVSRLLLTYWGNRLSSMLPCLSCDWSSRRINKLQAASSYHRRNKATKRSSKAAKQRRRKAAKSMA